MRISIITPSFKSLSWLKLCAPSIADQGVELEHIVQDSCSPDGTGDWLSTQPGIRACIEKDRGMYDAVNRGYQKAQGEIVAYLNCDEQYLPGALKAVLDYFDRNPEVEVAFADAVVVDPKGGYLCHRQALVPHRAHSMVSNNLAILTCATFLRRSLLDKRGLYFNADLKDVGDADWVCRLVDQGVRMGLMNFLTSAFTDTGENMNLRPNAIREKAEMAKRAPVWAQKLRLALILQHRVRRLAAGHYSSGPFSYSIYTSASPHRRVEHRVSSPTARWIRYTPELQAT